MLGYERDEILGKHYEQILKTDNGAQISEFYGTVSQD